MLSGKKASLLTTQLLSNRISDVRSSDAAKTHLSVDASLSTVLIMDVPMQRIISTRSDASISDFSVYCTPKEKALVTPLEKVGSRNPNFGADDGDDDDDGSSAGTISTTESFPVEISSINLEPTEFKHIMETINVTLTEHLKTTGGEGYRILSATPSLRRRRKKTPSRGSLTPPITQLSRSQSFSVEESILFTTPIRHFFPSESFRLSSADKNSEDLFWDKFPEETSPNHDYIPDKLPASKSKEINPIIKEKNNREEELSSNSSGVALDKVLMQTSALPDLDLSCLLIGTENSSELQIGGSENIEQLAKFPWWQLLARWRHKKLEKAMMLWPTSEHFFEIQQNANFENFSCFPISNDDDGIQLLSPYLAELGPLPCCFDCESSSSSILVPNNDGILDSEKLICYNKGRLHRWDWGHDGKRFFIQDIRHELNGCHDARNFKSKLTVLNSAAEEHLPQLTSLLQLISSDWIVHHSSFSPYAACVKPRAGVVVKARSRYKGDVTLVKDILRGSVIAPNESSLVCALLALFKASRDESSFTIVRFKNLFRVSNLGAFVPTNLPTGYRHVLVNIRLNNGLLAEIQFHLLQMYELMGHKGHELHQYLMGYGASDCCDNDCEELLNSSKNAEPLTDHVLRICSCSEPLFEIFVGNRVADHMISYALHELSENKWDLSIYMCLSQLLQTRFLSHGNMQSDKSAAISLLARALEVADRICSIGMIGWEAYGMSSPLDRVSGRPIDILSEHACFLAMAGDWQAASDLFAALLSKCERQLALCHPRTIASLLDLASSLSWSSKKSGNGEHKAIIGLIERANCRVSFYLKLQALTLSRIGKGDKIGEKDDSNTDVKANFNLLTGAKFLRAFVSNLLTLLKRPMLRIVGKNHATTLFFHGYIADSLAILAVYSKDGCPGHDQGDIHSDLEFSELSATLCWQRAGEHYREALKGWITLYGRRVSHAATTACGLARCLWELGKGREAFILLSKVIGFDGQTCPEKMPQLRSSKKSDLAYERSLAFSIWWMCVYFSRKFTRQRHAADNRLHTQIMSLLGTSAKFLRSALRQYNQPSSEHVDEVRLKCEAALAVIESEVARLSSIKPSSK